MEDTCERIVVLLRDRIELVIVAAGAGNRQAQEATSQGVDAIVEFIGSGFSRVGILVVLGTESKVAECSEISQPFGFVDRHHIGSDLVFDKKVEGHVGIEGLNNPIAIPVPVGVRLDAERVRLILGVPRHIEPVAAPSFPVSWRIQEPIDQLGKGVGVLIGKKGIDFLRSWRQAGQVKACASNQLPFSCFRNR